MGASLKSWSPSTTKNVRSSVDSITVSRRSCRVCSAEPPPGAEVVGRDIDETDGDHLASVGHSRSREDARGHAEAGIGIPRVDEVDVRLALAELPHEHDPEQEILPVDPVPLRSMAE